MEERELTFELTDIDWVIINEMQKDARVKASHIARMVIKSSQYISDRIRILHENNILWGTKALINPIIFGVQFYAFGYLTKHQDVSDKFLQRELNGIDEVCECHCGLGSNKYLIKVAVCDIKHLKLLTKRIDSLSGVKDFEFTLTSEMLINRVPILRR